MNIARRYVGRFAHRVCIITSLASLFACAGQPIESQVQSINEIAVSAEDANALAEVQAWMRKESPEELAVLIPLDQDIYTPDGTRIELDGCARVSRDLAEVVVNEMVSDVLIRAGITPIRSDSRAEPQNLILAVTLHCNDAHYTYSIHFAHMDENGATAREVSYGHIGSRAETRPSDVLSSLRYEVELVVGDYMAANSI